MMIAIWEGNIDMDLNYLREFVLIAGETSFQSAAKKLGVAPNVLSTRFHTFEKSLGATLIEPHAKTIRLTESGKAFLNDAKKLLRSYDEAVGWLYNTENVHPERLRLLLCAQTLTLELGPYLDLYCRRFPNLSLELHDENSCTIRDGLKTGQIDMAFAIGRKEDFSDISGRILLTHFPKMYVHLPNDHRLANRTETSFEELSGETFILYPAMKETCVRNLQLSMLKQSGIPCNIYEGFCSPSFFHLLVPMGKGILLWNWDEKPMPNTVTIPILDDGFDAYMFLLYEKDSCKENVIHFIDGFMKSRRERI